MGIHNAATTFFFRLGYAIWILKGANLLKPLSYYGKMMDNLTDDMETLRGAYGPRMRRWVGPDALQEAINENQNIDKEEEFVKPIGIDQVEAVYKDIKSGMTESVIQIFDPSLDFEETNYVPDLHRLSLVINDKKLDMVMDYLAIEEGGHMVNDLFFVELLKAIYCGFLGIATGKTYIHIARTIKGFEEQRAVLVGAIEDAGTFTSPEDFWAEFDMFLDFEKHMRMQVNEKTFPNSEISVPAQINSLKKRYLDTFKNRLLTDMGLCLLVCAILKYGDNVSNYDECIKELYDSIQMTDLKEECKDFADNLGYKLVD